MTCTRNNGHVPSWISDASVRRAINEQIKRRRAKRKRALADFEAALRVSEQRAPDTTK